MRTTWRPAATSVVVTVAATLLGVAAAWLLLSPATPEQRLQTLLLAMLVILIATAAVIGLGGRRLRRACDGEALEAERLRMTLRAIGDGVIATDAQGRVVSLNPVAEQLTGWTQAEASGRAIEEVFRIVHEETREPVEAPIRHALTERAIVGLARPTVLLTRDGRERPIEDSAAPVRRTDGRVDGAILVFRDVSERRAAEATSRAREQELSDFFEQASVGLQFVGPDGIIQRANQAQVEMLGYATRDYVGRPQSEFYVNPDEARSLLTRTANGETLRSYATRMRCADGSIRHVAVSSSGRREGGEFVHGRYVTVDISDRHRVDRLRGLLAAVVESTDDAVISKSLDGRILSWNAGATAMFGYQPSEIVGASINLIIRDADRAAERRVLARIVAAERILPFETQRVAKNGDVLDVSVTLSPIRDESGRIIGASSIARDIRSRLALEHELRESDRRKDEFLAVLAHELRNPLAPIRNGVAALRLALPADPVIRQTGAIIERQVQQMARLLDDLLDVSRITHNKLGLQREVLSIGGALEMALETCRPMLQRAGQTVEVDAGDPSWTVTADPVRLAQIFSNLVGNASTYSHPGARIRIAARGEEGELVVAVADEGIGITEDALPHIFEMFSQASQAKSRAQGGVGIGLALVKGLVDLHGGRVSASSPGKGRGSTFEVRLPLTHWPVAPPPETSDTPRAIETLRRVVVADDNHDGADSMAMMLRTFGCEVRTAYDGEGAIDAFEAMHPHLVLLDLGMPGVDGFEAARQIRRRPGGDDTMIVAITGWGQEADRRRTTEAGFDVHLVKPVDPLTLRSLVEPQPQASRP